MSSVELNAGESGDPRGGVIPYLMVDGAVTAAAFYGKAFGAREVGRVPEDEKGRTMHVHLYINEGSVMLCDPYPEYGRPLEGHKGFTLTLTVDDVDFWWKRASETEGMETTVPLEKMSWGDRYGELKDPFGVCWAIVGK
ncbi:VOC family protein [Chelativorans sp. YIM 93263]|uniref:VOC family protein n=1 Tax=Chelativorans sp. YIM 93263 TaxID=2906648 RepID=UPI002379AAA7|nr:VOC family protein [Chelativorans sp. YIM 93263]